MVLLVSRQAYLPSRMSGKGSGIKLVFSQRGRMLTDLELRADIRQRLVHMFEHLFGVLTVITMGGKIRRHKLGFGTTTGCDDVRLSMFDGSALSHSLVSSTVCERVPGEVRHTVRCTVSGPRCKKKIYYKRETPPPYWRGQLPCAA